MQRQFVLGRGAEIARDRNDASRRWRWWCDDTLFEHACEAMDVEHVGAERVQTSVTRAAP